MNISCCLSTRFLTAIVAGGSLILILIALYMQHVMGLTPCYLCITQRIFVIAIGIIALCCCIQNPGDWGRRIYGGLLLILALGGSFFSGKQLWLQNLPEDKIPACGPPADYLFEVFSFSEALGMLLQGDGNCAKVQWTLLGISIPGWTLMCFIGFALIGGWLLFRKS